MKKETEYEKQAREFAERNQVTMTARYQGHYSRLGTYITANYRVTLERTGRAPFGFEFSTSINDSWGYTEQGKLNIQTGLPPRVDLDKFFAEYLKKPVSEYRQYRILQRMTPPKLYDVLACLTKSDPGSFDDFCGDYGYSNDSINAEKTWRAVAEEWRSVSRIFGDVIDELQEIN